MYISAKLDLLPFVPPPTQACQPTLPREKCSFASSIHPLMHIFLRSWFKGCIYQDHLADNWALWRLQQVNKLIKKLYWSHIQGM